MKYLSVCSGIEAASVAWHHLGWEPVAFSEIEPFPAAVLAHRFPNVPNYGDMTKHKEWPIEPGSIDLLVGGTPCQSFSVAGLRKGLHDPRGGLMLTYLEIAQRLRPRWVVWENVPGVLSSGGGRDFGSFLGALGELGYGWAYRVLDAQWVRTQRHPRAVPQRRRRVFVVGCLVERGAGDRNPAAEVLLESESVCRDSAPRRAPGQGAAPDAEAGARAGCYWNGEDIASALTRKGCDDRMPDKERLFAVLQPAVYAWQNNDLGLKQDDVTAALRSSAGTSGFHEMNHPVVVQQPVPVTKSKRAQCTEDDETWVDGQVNPTLSLFDQGDTRATTVAVAFQACGDRDNPSVSVSDAAFCLPANPMSDRGQAVAFSPGNLARGAGASPNSEVAPTMKCSAGRGADDQRTCVAHAFYSTDGTHGVNQQPEVSPAVKVGSNLGIPSPPAVAFTRCDNGQDAAVEVTPTMRCGSNYSAHPAVACPTLTAHNDPSRSPQSAEVTQQVAAVHATTMTVRRLTCRECERLQGFPDDWTLIPWRKKFADECPDGPRYKALGNSMACNCMAFIGERINAWERKNKENA